MKNDNRICFWAFAFIATLCLAAFLDDTHPSEQPSSIVSGSVDLIKNDSAPIVTLHHQSSDRYILVEIAKDMNDPVAVIWSDGSVEVANYADLDEVSMMFWEALARNSNTCLP